MSLYTGEARDPGAGEVGDFGGAKTPGFPGITLSLIVLSHEISDEWNDTENAKSDLTFLV